MTVDETIAAAEAILPGHVAPEGEIDPRWQAIIAIGEFIDSEPEAVWTFISRWGGYPDSDLRMAIATCLLEHLLEYHFDAFFPRVEQRALADALFAKTFCSCWKFGQAKNRKRAARFDRLVSAVSLRGAARMFRLTHREFRRLSRRARTAKRANHLEVVGLLASSLEEPLLLRLFFLKNRASRPGRWELRKQDVVDGRRALRRSGLRAIGLFHSHPLTAATLGPRDRRSTPTGWHHLVYDVCGLDARLYVLRRRNGRRRVEELPLLVERSNADAP
jgi:proteasome lid subunit RPN8/RPN11